MKINLQKKISTVLGVGLLFLVMIPFAVYAIGTIATGFRIDAQTSVPVAIDAHSECWNVKNQSSALDYFVPTKIATEWTNFRAAYMNIRPADIYPCELPNTQCRLHYQYKIDNKMGEIKWTPWTDNTTNYASGPYSLVKTGKDDTCNGSQACGIRVGVQCTGEYGISVTYEMKFEGVSGGVRTTGYPTLGGGVKWGAWSQRQYETGDNECDGAGNCRVSMTVADNYSGVNPVTCSIGYQHRTDESVSGWKYDGVEAIANNNGSGDGENCENGGCGLQTRLYCSGPPAGTASPPPAGAGQVNGQCGPADGGGYPATGPPAGDRCTVGAVTGYTYNSLTGQWTWQCAGTSGGINDYCTAFNLEWSEWNPPRDPGGGGPDEDAGNIHLY